MIGADKTLYLSIKETEEKRRHFPGEKSFWWEQVGRPQESIVTLDAFRGGFGSQPGPLS